MKRRDFLKHSAVASGIVSVGRRPELQSDAQERAGQGQKSSGAADRWIVPKAPDKRPIWGIQDGIQFGLWPADVEGQGTGGPRGLIRIGYPILDGGKSIGLVNFIAIEPIVDGRRGFSELETSESDGRQGRVFWSGESSQAGASPDAGTVSTVAGVQRLSVRVNAEPFANGARPFVNLEIRADQPGELRLTISSAPGSARMDFCVLTATMGNYSRLRRLWLQDEVIQAGKLLPDFTGNEFTTEAFFPMERFLCMPDGDRVVCATSDETDPHSVPPDPAAPGWAYRGSFPLTQYWRKPKDPCPDRGLKVRVNGRRVYWASHNPIPGGMAYENFDMVQPFCEGQALVFGLTRRLPADVARGLVP
jgi:hypothetical protein